MMLFLMAAVPALCGVGCLFHSWKSARKHGRNLVIYGWLLLLLSLLSWIQLAGAEYGVVFALLFPAFFAWLMIVFQRRKGRRKTSAPQTVQPMPAPSWQGIGRNIVRFLWLFAGLGVAMLLVSVALVMQFPFAANLNLASALLLFPLLWAASVCWFLSSRNPWKVSLLSTVAALVSSLWLLV